MSAAPRSSAIDRWQPSVAGRWSPKRVTTSRAPREVRAVGEHEVEVRAADLGLQRRRRALGDDLARGDDAEPVAELVGLLEVLRREEDRRALVAQAADLVPQRQARGRVQAGRRLVEEQHLGLVDERHREVQAAAHAAGVRRDAAVGGAGQADALDELRAAGAHRARRDAVQRGLQLDELRAGHEPVERRLLQRDADPAAHLRRAAWRRRSRRRARARRSGAAASRASARSSSCRRRWVRGSRTPRPARPRDRSRRRPSDRP